MKCVNPFVTAGGAFGCGQCLPCRINQRRIWASRIVVESLLHQQNAFITLTYEERNLPYLNNSPLPTLVPRDLQLWLKRFRTATALPLRFYAAGEYGDLHGRPHYHVAMFGYPPCLRVAFGLRHDCQCVLCRTVRDTWGLGNIQVGTLTADSAAYCAQYITKKSVRSDNEWLQGRHPEFARMSLRPGIGGGAVPSIAATWADYKSAKADVPYVLYRGDRSLPLGRYLVRRTRKHLGLPLDAPQSVMDQVQADVLPMRLAARADNENPSTKKRLVDRNRGAEASLAARSAIKEVKKL